MAALRNQLLKLTLPLVRTHGFTREALSLSVLSLPTPHAEPLGDAAVSALFGTGDDARRTLVNAWLDEGRAQMRTTPAPTIKDALTTRLKYNYPVLGLLPEAFAALATPPGLHIFDPQPAFRHAVSVADEACVITGDDTVGASWYARRGVLAAVYTAAELHQMNSPDTAEAFLESLLESSAQAKASLDDTTQFASYIISSWKGILKSQGVLI